MLEGIRVLELANARPPGTICGHLLADLGADVIKVQAPGEGGRGDERARAFDGQNRNKRSVTLDLKQPKARDAFYRLAKTADVVLECSRPGVAKRLGIDFGTLRGMNDRLVYCSLTGFGQTGPYAQFGLHDTETAGARAAYYQAPDTVITPTMFGVLLGDPAGALHAAIGILAALVRRGRTGQGELVDVAMADSVSTFNFGKMEGALSGSGERGPAHFDRAAYRCGDGKFVLTTNPEHWKEFCELIDRPDLAGLDAEHDPEARRRGIEDIKKIMLTRTRDEWFAAITATGGSVARCLEPAEVIADPQVLARGLVWDLVHPTQGAVRQWGFPIFFGSEPGGLRRFAPRAGEDNAAVLGELGYSAAEIAEIVPTVAAAAR